MSRKHELQQDAGGEGHGEVKRSGLRRVCVCTLTSVLEVSIHLFLCVCMSGSMKRLQVCLCVFVGLHAQASWVFM